MPKENGEKGKLKGDGNMKLDEGDGADEVDS